MNLLYRYIFAFFPFFVLVDRATANIQCSDFWKKTTRPSSSTSELLNRHRESETLQGVLPAHQTKFLIHNSSNQMIKTEVVVIVYHGLMNSPRDMQFLAKDLFEMGANVINARLDGHYEKSRSELDSVNYQDWVAQLDDYLGMARHLGEKVVIVGHSTGGLASIHTALQNKVDGMVLLSPALKTRALTDALTYMGSSLGVSGWVLDALSSQDRYKSTYAGVQVDRWGDLLRDIPGEKMSTPSEYGLVQERLENMPLLWFDTESDHLIDPRYNMRIAQRFKNVEYLSFPSSASVSHNSMAVPKMNKEYPQMVEIIRQFINERFRNP